MLGRNVINIKKSYTFVSLLKSISNRNPDRKSGIGEDPVDDTIERLQAVGEESDNSSEEDFVAALNVLPGNIIEAPAQGPGPQAPPAAGQLAMAIPTAQKLATIPMYDGTRGESYLNWLDLVENALAAYQWDHKAIMQVAQLKGGSKVQEGCAANISRELCLIAGS